MGNFLEGGVEELEQVKAAILDEANKYEAAQAVKRDLKDKEKEIEREKKETEDEIRNLLKSKRKAEASPYDDELDDADKMLKDSIRRRKEAKTDAVQRRISNETADVEDAIKKLKKENKKMLKNGGMPGFCATNFYFSMFAPKTAKDFLVIVIAAVICFAAIPNIVIALAKLQTFQKVLLYIAIVIFFILIYALVLIATKPVRKKKTLDLVRPNMDSIRQYRKQIKKLSRHIKKDQDESGYGLTDLDNEIVRNQGIYDNAAAKREEALKQFEETQIPEIRAEIERAKAPVMDELYEDLDMLKKDAQTKELDAKQAAYELERNYTTYLGKKNMDPNKIDELISIIKEGRASNILEAMDVRKEKAN